MAHRVRRAVSFLFYLAVSWMRAHLKWIVTSPSFICCSYYRRFGQINHCAAITHTYSPSIHSAAGLVFSLFFFLVNKDFKKHCVRKKDTFTWALTFICKFYKRKKTKHFFSLLFLIVVVAARLLYGTLWKWILNRSIISRFVWSVIDDFATIWKIKEIITENSSPR